MKSKYNHALLGSLIGLIRAINGNEDLVTNDTNALIIKALKQMIFL